MLNADEVEIKAVIALEAIVFKKVEQNFVTEINQEPVDMEALNSACFKRIHCSKRRYSLEAGKGKLHNNRKNNDS